MQQLELRLCLKNVMGSIDRYAEHDKIEAIRPIVTILLCNFCGLYNYPRIEPGLLRIYMQRSRFLSGLKPNDLVITTQFLEFNMNSASPDEPVDDYSYI